MPGRRTAHRAVVSTALLANEVSPRGVVVQVAAAVAFPDATVFRIMWRGNASVYRATKIERLLVPMGKKMK